MSTYKLTYFNVTGYGEAIRMLLHQSGIKFEDKRITYDDWPKLKSEMPIGQVPVLEIDGKKYHQSKAICRLIARQNGLYGSDDLEAYEIDATIETISDFVMALSRYYYENNPAFKEELKIVAYKMLPFYLDKLEEQVKRNGGYFVDGKLTWADIYYASLVDYLRARVEGDFDKDHPELNKLAEKVKALPKIKAYLDTRPDTAI